MSLDSSPLAGVASAEMAYRADKRGKEKYEMERARGSRVGDLNPRKVIFGESHEKWSVEGGARASKALSFAEVLN